LEHQDLTSFEIKYFTKKVGFELILISACTCRWWQGKKWSSVMCQINLQCSHIFHKSMTLSVEKYHTSNIQNW